MFWLVWCNNIYPFLNHVVVLDCKEQQPSQLGAQEVHKTVKDNFLVYIKAELVGNIPEITVCEFCLAMEK